MKALILAAGFGTRLKPYTQTLPKALFPIAGIPVLGRMINALKQAGCTGIAVNAHHLAHRIQSYLAETDFGLPIHLSHEPDILGTGGAIRRLRRFWDDDPFMVVNADIVTDIDLAQVYRRHCQQKDPVTLVMHDRPAFNQVWVRDDMRIIGFERFSVTMPQVGHRNMAFTGIHVLNPDIVQWIPADGFCDIIAVYRQMIDAGAAIHAHVVRGHYWQDMGSPERYRDAAMDALAPRAFQAAFDDNPPYPYQREALAGDGSDRRWYRLTAGRHRLILVDHGITPLDQGSEVNAFVRIGEHLYHCGLPVPQIFAHDAFSGLVFLQDLGNCHLQRIVQQTDDESRIEGIYQPIIDTLVDITVRAADGFNPDWTCQSTAYDVHLILDKECRYFVDAFLNGYLDMGIAYDDLAPEFNQLAQRTVDFGVNGLIHRDFQSRNIMVKDGRHYLIDYQGARRGPVQYDLAALLIDPYVGLSRALKARLMSYGAQQASLRLNTDPDRFIQGYRYCAVTRNLQMLGAFGFLSRVKHKHAFETWIPAAAGMLAGHLRDADPDAFPKLMAIAAQLP